MVEKISFDRKSLIINGERRFIFSGSVHYFRLSSPKQWEDRIKKLKSLGFNAVDSYYYWAYHSPQEGRYDFQGARDIELFMRMIEDQGMYLIARPGPYICAEVDGGGFPGWLITKRELKLRCRNNGKFVYDPEYIKFCEQWYQEVIPRINKFKNLILLQIENEYNFLPTPRGILAQIQGVIQRRLGADFFMRLLSSGLFYQVQLYLQRRAFQSPDYRVHNQYLKELYEMVRKLGVSVPIFHNDVAGATRRFVDVDLVAIDDYPITNFASDWKEKNPFAKIDLFEAGHNALKMDCPLFGAEIQGGWYDLWGGFGYERIRRQLGPLAMDFTLKSCLAQGMSILNLYLAVGGTNLGYMSSPDVYTSIDYGAPITEGGNISERGEVCKKFSEFVFRYEKELLESSPEEEQSEKGGRLFVRVRKSPNATYFVFLRNLTGKAQKVRTKFGEFQIGSPEMKVLVLDRTGKEIDQLGSEKEAERKFVFGQKPQPSLLDLRECRFKIYDAPFKEEAGFRKISKGEMDLDQLSAHYGFVWYRARFHKPISWVKIDARHLWTLYLNQELIKSFDNFRNRLGVGEDLALKVKVNLAKNLLKEENTLVLLVESLGHNKGFMEDSHHPRALVSAETDEGELSWEALPGLIPGEQGITPKLDFSGLISLGELVRLPHQVKAGCGLGIYLAEFELNLTQPDPKPLGVKIRGVSGKANIYLNGFLIGRYWEKLGPQKIFYLPPDLMELKGKKQIAVVVWSWEKEIRLGELSVVEYP